jgi:hypothetical protein
MIIGKEQSRHEELIMIDIKESYSLITLIEEPVTRSKFVKIFGVRK